MNKVNSLVGGNIRTTRQKRGLSQERLALKAGLNTSYLGQIERGEKSPTISVIDKIASALDVNIKDIFETNLELENIITTEYIDKIVYELKSRTTNEQEDVYYFIQQLLMFKDKK
ncbi:helix-turn-helix transcriptional regulator [Paenibacillus sp. 2003]|uniref:helix-turn-helix domain-containing protein n=1 Tax=Paenibacillus sp. 2003 TaxID=2817761 RepID=UPI00285D8DF9|nr:helix-turn-helix transcriptional regulator [Paenibacillus sp. 2003]MDR6720891.1 transcriptional regulator with XRE-family HTH domain [Paenibacillus sp. 2003]